MRPIRKLLSLQYRYNKVLNRAGLFVDFQVGFFNFKVKKKAVLISKTDENGGKTSKN